MKNIFLNAFLIALCLSVVSCDKEDEVEPSIVGTWSATSISRDNCWDGNDRSLNFDCENDFCLEYTYNNDGTVTQTYTDPNSGATTYNGEYTLVGNSLTNCDASGDCEEVTATISGDTMTFEYFEAENEGSADGCDVTITFTRV